MPSKNRVAGVAVEISEKIPELGYTVDEIVGPVEIEDEDGENIVENKYYVHAEKGNTYFYVHLTDRYKFCQIVYPYNIASLIGQRLSESEIQHFTDLAENNEEEQTSEVVAGTEIIEQTPIEKLWEAKFNLAMYSSMPSVNYSERTSQNGFTLEFQTTRGIFPYTESLSLRNLDERVESVLIAGDRGARYAESAFFVEKEDRDIYEYELSTHF
jgi:hypothetical protein